MKKYKVPIILGLVILTAVVSKSVFTRVKKNTLQSQIFTHPAIQNPEVSGRRLVNRIELREPKKAFNFTLVNMNNAPVSLEDYKGKLVLVGFIYTNCPDVCGVLTMHYRRIQRTFESTIDKDLVLILISTDPKRDTPERVKAYTQGFQGKWHFLTGTESQLKEVWANYRVFVKEKEDADLVYHSYMVVLIDRAGFIRYRYVGLVDPQEVIEKDIQQLLKERSQAL